MLGGRWSEEGVGFFSQGQRVQSVGTTGVRHQERGHPLGFCRVLLLLAPLVDSFTLRNSLFLPLGSHHTMMVATL